MIDDSFTQLQTLAGMYGIQTSYLDVRNELVTASPGSLLAILRSLGCRAGDIADVSQAIADRQGELDRLILQPVIVAWDGYTPDVRLRLPVSIDSGSVKIMFHPDRESAGSLGIHPVLNPEVTTVDLAGETFTDRRISIPAQLPWGYHRLRVVAGGVDREALIISAPPQAYGQPAGERGWGVFIPLYSLHSAQSWGAGNFTDLKNLIHWVGETGGNLVGTLPIMASFLDEPFDPSPYATASRLFWNEFYIDPSAIPEFAASPDAQRIVSDNQKMIAELRRSEFLDYRREMALKRKVIEAVARTFFADSSARLDSFNAYVESRPVLQDYARFRAAGEKYQSSWHAWPERLRDGTIRMDDVDASGYRYHCYVQWIAEEQLELIAGESRKKNVRLYMDYPVGVHASSYDVWRHRSCFVDGMSVGAPPDAFFTGGQDWGFPPLHPEKVREEKLGYVIDSLRTIFRHAGIVRLDHVMGLHRLFWIPGGMKASQGTYVSYNAEEFYAILTLESHRAKSIVVGEDLGIVPPAVREEMNRRDLNRMYIMQFEVGPDPHYCARPVPPKHVASLNTHDTPPFASFWIGRDIDERVQYGFLKPERVEDERSHREAVRNAMRAFLQPRHADTDDDRMKEMLRSSLLHLARSDAWIVLVNIEDLWLETRAQNIPGTYREHPNWLRRGRESFTLFSSDPFAMTLLKQLDEARKHSR
jgi:4-alpha-glucanotransferase